MSLKTIGGRKYDCRLLRVRSGKGKKKHTRAFCRKPEGKGKSRRRRSRK